MFTCVQSRWKNSKTVEIQIQTCLLEKEKRSLCKQKLHLLERGDDEGNDVIKVVVLTSISSVGREKKPQSFHSC